MLEFKKPEISDKEWANKCLAHANSMNCFYSPRAIASGKILEELS